VEQFGEDASIQAPKCDHQRLPEETRQRGRPHPGTVRSPRPRRNGFLWGRAKRPEFKRQRRPWEGPPFGRRNL